MANLAQHLAGGDPVKQQAAIESVKVRAAGSQLSEGSPALTAGDGIPHMCVCVCVCVLAARGKWVISLLVCVSACCSRYKEGR